MQSSISTVRDDGISVRGRDLVDDMMGHTSFTSMVFLLICGREPVGREEAMLDACLVALADHGLTLSAIVARANSATAPEALQGAVAAGLLGVGDKIAGAMEGCGEALHALATDPAEATGRDQLVADFVRRRREAGTAIPGLGHAFHKGGDPRADRLLQLAGDWGLAGTHCGLLHRLAAEVSAQVGKPVPINVTGAMAAALMDIGFEPSILRGFALIARCAGLVAHVHEEHRSPIVPELRKQLREASMPSA